MARTESLCSLRRLAWPRCSTEDSWRVPDLARVLNTWSGLGFRVYRGSGNLVSKAINSLIRAASDDSNDNYSYRVITGLDQPRIPNERRSLNRWV